MKKQLAFILARQQANVDTDDDMLREILNNTKLSENFRRFAKELNVMDAKTPDEIYKAHLEPGRAGASTIDSARHNLASTFVNAFVNAGFGNDKLMVESEEGQSWIYKNKDHGKYRLCRPPPGMANKRCRNVQRVGVTRLEHALGHRRWLESSRQVCVRK